MAVKGRFRVVGMVGRRKASSVMLLVMTMVSMLGFSIAMPGTAAAGELGSGGWAKGPSSIGQGSCSYMPAWAVLRISAAPPNIYAANHVSGWGNEWQWVQYRALLRDYNTGAIVASTPYTSLVKAYDNSPAQFSGVTTFDASWKGHYVLDYHIQWIDSRYSTPGAVTGWSIQRFDNYAYYSNRTGPYGPISSCLKYL